jgi:hypothetical protein
MNDHIFKRVAQQRLVEHFDANETAFLQRQLEQVRAKTFEVEYPELRARSFFPLASDIAPSAETYVYFVYDKTGHAKVIANGVDDLPRVETHVTERTGKVRSLGDSYGWNIVEMREAARLNVPLRDQKAMAASYFIAKLTDTLLATGKDPNMDATSATALGIPGFINNADIAGGGDARVVALTHVNASTTGAVQLANLNKLAVAVPNGSSNLYYADTIILPTAEYNLAATTRMNDFDSRTVLQAFLAGNPWIKTVEWWLSLNGAGATAKNRAVAYKRDPGVLEAVVPQEFEQLPPQERNLEFVINCHARCGGVKVYKPLACVYGDFADS